MHLAAFDIVEVVVVRMIDRAGAQGHVRTPNTASIFSFSVATVKGLTR